MSYHDPMRLAAPALAVLVAAALAAGCGGSETTDAAPATTEASDPATPAADPGLPEFTAGYEAWEKLNAEPFDTPGAHNGVKDVFASAPKDGDAYPDETVIVKSIQPEGETGRPFHVAVMHKVDGAWDYVEYERDESGTYGVLAQGSLCQSCHMQAEANDFVFTED